MPKKDGTGPTGKGPLTGYGSGDCIIPLNTQKEELIYLKNQAQILQKELKTITNRIAKLEKLGA